VSQAIQYPYQDLDLANRDGEEWEDIPGLDGYYLISNFGRVKRVAFEVMSYNGQSRWLKEKIMVPFLTILENHSVGDQVYHLRARATIAGISYNISIARTVYYCFVKKFDLANPSLVVLAKDCDNKNIHPGNLVLVDLSRKQKRIFERDRFNRELDNAFEAFANGQIESGNPFCKQVTQYTLEGKKVQTYPSIEVAAEVLGITPNNIISVLKGRQISGGGFVWRYGKEKSVDVEAVRAKNREGRKKLVGQKVSQYDNTGTRIATYLTIADASQATGVNQSDIHAVFNGRQRSAGGFIWRRGWGKLQIDLSGYAIGEEWRAMQRYKKVKQYSAEGKYLNTYSSVKEAAQSLNISPSYISMVLNKDKLAKGFIWKSVDR
jgi:hypothetical protein